MTYMYLPLGLGGGRKIHNFFVSLPYRCFISYLVQIGPLVLEKMNGGRLTSQTHDDGRQLIAIGHLSDSGDLNTTHIAKT